MSEETEIQRLMNQIQQGDQDAAAELVRRYEPLIRRMVRVRLTDTKLTRVFESMDVCQSVLNSFFVRAAVGDYELSDPSQLVNLLVTMAKNKVASAARRQYRQKRDSRRLSEGEGENFEPINQQQETPSIIVQGKELLDRAHDLMRDDERMIAHLRREGFSWEEIAEQLGGTAQARRVQLSRAMERIIRELELDPE